MSVAAALQGSLFRYRPSPGALQAFESPAGHAHSRYAIFLGGLTDGLLACAYVEQLAALCDSKGWALVQPILSSSYAGYGCSSLQRDVEELSELTDYLERTRQVSAFAIIGHSTGCQDTVQFMATASVSTRQKVRACVLQAPVSDREAWALEGNAEERERLLDLARSLVEEGKGTQLLPELHYGFVPITADRYMSLFGVRLDQVRLKHGFGWPARDVLMPSILHHTRPSNLSVSS